jgi:hypothetical protein
MDWAATVPGVLLLVSEIRLNIDLTKDMMPELMRAVQRLTTKEVLAGFPESEEKERKNEKDQPVPLTNAAIAYVQNTGSPELNIPARPFMVEGIEDVKDQIVDRLEKVGRAALEGDAQRVDKGFHEVGLTAQNGIRNKIQVGPFEPLAESTLKARARSKGKGANYRRGRKGAQEELDRRAAGEAPGVDLARPLIFSAQLRNAATYAVQDKDKS